MDQPVLRQARGFEGPFSCSCSHQDLTFPIGERGFYYPHFVRRRRKVHKAATIVSPREARSVHCAPRVRNSSNREKHFMSCSWTLLRFREYEKTSCRRRIHDRTSFRDIATGRLSEPVERNQM